MCDVDIGSVLVSFLPAIGSIALVAALASSQDSDAAARSSSFAIATFGLVAYNIYTAAFDIDDAALLSAGGQSTFVSDFVYDYTVWFDGLVVVAAVVSELASRPLPASLWLLVAGFSALIHGVGVLLGDYTGSAVVISGLVTLGALDSVGDAVAGITDALPAALQVRNAPLHKLLSLGLLFAAYANAGDEIADILMEEDVISIGIAAVASVLFLYVDPGSPTARVLAVAGLTAVPVALYYMSDALGVKGASRDAGTCVETVSNLTYVEMAAERSANLQDTDLAWYLLHIASGLLLASGFVMNAASDIGVQVTELTDYVKSAVAPGADRGHERGHHGAHRSGHKSTCAPTEGCEDAEVDVPAAIKAGQVARQPGHARAIP